MNSQNNPGPKFLLILSALVVSLFAAFYSGAWIWENKVFPYSLIESLISHDTQSSGSKSHASDSIDSNLLVLNKKTFNTLNPDKLVGWGGGLAKLGNRILGVDKDGRFFIYKKSGVIKKLDIAIQTNKDLLVDFLKGDNSSPNKKNQKEIKRKRLSQDLFRVLDIAIQEKENNTQIIVSHHYWHPDRLGKTTRISRLTANNVLDIIDGKERVDANEWEVIFESELISFRDEIGAFTSNRSGGRMALDSDNSLIVGFGDHRFDGYLMDFDAAQDDDSSYGKVIRIDLKTLDARVVAKGIRNPQGLHIDRDGNIWETEHGPRGGDELNLIHENKNYGWPFVSYGTNYRQYEWPPNKKQGRHEGFELPVFAWTPSIGISNVIQVQNAPEEWHGDLLVASLIRMTLYRMRIRDSRVILVEPIKIGARIRDLVQMNDGTLLLWTDKAHFIELSEEQLSAITPFPLTKKQIDIGLDEVIQDCSECHGFNRVSTGENELSLSGIYGRKIAGSDYAGYSDALKKLDGVWNKKNLKAFLADPQQFAPGTTMPDTTIDNVEQLDALVEYLARFKNYH
jgi:cytochrome c2